MKILLVVSGGIAAYRACEIVSLARKVGHEVRVAMTPHATRLVAPLTFEALSGSPVLLDTFDGPERGVIDHIAWARWPDVVVVAPATANILGKLACGLADDGATTLLMAVPASVRVILAPAMNTHMWFNPVVQRNRRWLAEFGRFEEVGPVEKRLACGDVGMGGMAEPSEILQVLENHSKSMG